MAQIGNKNEFHGQTIELWQNRLYHKVDIFIVGMWWHTVFSFSAKKVMNIDFDQNG